MTATGRSLRSSASTTSLPPRLPSSTSNIHHDSPTTSRRASHSKQEPSLAELIRAEQDWDNAAAPTRSHAIEAAPFAADVTNDATKPHARRRSSAPLPDLPPDATEELAPQAMPPFAGHPLPPVPPLLLPPHYGKPIRPSSPDAFACVKRNPIPLLGEELWLTSQDPPQCPVPTRPALPFSPSLSLRLSLHFVPGPAPPNQR